MRSVDERLPDAGVAASGPAFPWTAKLLAAALVGAQLFWGWRVAASVLSAGLPLPAALMLAAALLASCACLWAMWRSRTSVDDTHIRQSWLWRKEVRLSDITQARFIHVPGLSWLLVPRLVVRVAHGGLLTFPSADAGVRRAFSRLAFAPPGGRHQAGEGATINR